GSCTNCSYLSFPSAPTCQYCHAPRPIQQNSHLAALAQHAASAAAPAFGFPAHLPFSSHSSISQPYNAPASAAAPQGFPASAAQFPGLMPQQPHFPHPGADFSASVQPSEGPYSLGFGRLDPAATRSERLAPRGSGQIENKSDEACVSMMESVPGSY